ncbi:uncharacterized protein [Odocoileus virginianus]|uniref:Uncharacterized protein n=1 Tax=Odocoileus virginianus TaxID=9874 RepID=A0ABM4IMB0_ODOVR
MEAAGPKTDFLPFCLPHALGHTHPAARPVGSNQWERSFCSVGRGPGALWSFQEGERPWRAARGVPVGAHSRARRVPSPLSLSPPAAAAVAVRGPPGLRSGRRLVRRGRRGPGGEEWKGQGVKARLKVEPNFAAGDARGGDARGRGGGGHHLALQWASWTFGSWHCPHLLAAGAPSRSDSLRALPPHEGRRATLQAGQVGRTPLPEPGFPGLPKGAVSLPRRFYAPLASPEWPPDPRASGALAAAGELWRARPHPGGAADSPAPRAAPRARAAALRKPRPHQGESKAGRFPRPARQSHPGRSATSSPCHEPVASTKHPALLGCISAFTHFSCSHHLHGHSWSSKSSQSQECSHHETRKAFHRSDQLASPPSQAPAFPPPY